MPDIEHPQDWGIANKNEWVTTELLSGEALMPVLEGRDVIGFVETVDFAAGQFIPDNVKKMAAGQPNYTFTNPQTGKTYLKRNGHWTVSGQDAKEVQNRMSRAIDSNSALRERVDAPKPKPKPDPEPKQEEKPKIPPKQSNPAPETSQVVEEKSLSDVDRYSLDIVSEEDVKRVANMASRGANDSIFSQGQTAIEQIDSHYSGPSPAQELFSRFPQNIKSISDALKEGNLDAKIKMQGGKEVLTLREIMLKAGVRENELQAVSSFISLLDSQTEPNGTWSTSATYSLSPGMDYFSAKMIEQRSDLASPDTSVRDVQTKALSFGSIYEDSKEWAGLSPAAIDLIFETRTAKQRESLKKSGTPNYYYDPTAPNEQGAANNIRGRMALFLYARQGGRDCYVGAGNVKPVGDFQVEHIEDMSSGGRDHRDNFGLSVKYVNEARGSMSLPNMVNLAERKSKEVDKNLASPSGRFLQERLGALRQRGVHDALSVTNSPLKGAISDLISPKFFSIIADKQKGLPEELRTSQSDFDSFVEEISNNHDGNVKIQELSKAKTDNLIALLEKLGADPSKVRDYMGRNSFNNYHDGSRPGRGGTNESPAGLTSLENRALGKPDTLSAEQYGQVVNAIADSHAAIRNAREILVKGKDGSNTGFLEVVSNSLHFISGKADDSPQLLKDRPSNPRDVLFVIDTYLKNFPPERKVEANLDGLYLSAGMSEYGFSIEEISNPNLIRQKAKRGQAEKLRNALNMIRGGSNE